MIGLGGVGGYVGARLIEAGHDVALVGRGAHLAAIRESGLRVESPLGDVVVRPALATENPADVGVVDHVIVGVKAWQVRDAVRTIAPLIGPATAVLPLQNGIEAPDEISQEIGPQHVLGGTMRIISYVVASGHIKHVGAEPTVELGELDGESTSTRVGALASALQAARGITARVPTDIRAAMWSKFLLITPWSGLGAVSMAPIGVIREVPQTRMLLEAAAREIERVGRRSGIKLADNIVPTTMAFLDTLPREGTTSMQRDIAAGKPSELDSLCGALVRRAAAHGEAVPVHETFLHALLPQELRARGMLTF